MIESSIKNKSNIKTMLSYRLYCKPQHGLFFNLCLIQLYIPVVCLLSEECLNAEHVDVTLVEYLYVDVMLQLVG